MFTALDLHGLDPLKKKKKCCTESLSDSGPQWAKKALQLGLF